MTLSDMGETRSNHTVYNINYHFVWCPKYRHSVLDEIEQSLKVAFREVCGEYNYEILSLYISPDHVHLFVSAPETFPERDCTGNPRASQSERCGSNTNHSWKPTFGVADSGKNRTTVERLVRYRARRLNNISNALNTSNGAYGIHPRGQVVRDACGVSSSAHGRRPFAWSEGLRPSPITEIGDFRMTPRHSACFLCRTGGHRRTDARVARSQRRVTSWSGCPGGRGGDGDARGIEAAADPAGSRRARPGPARNRLASRSQDRGAPVPKQLCRVVSTFSQLSPHSRRLRGEFDVVAGVRLDGRTVTDVHRIE